jgi:hypothetical protein
VKLRLLWFVSLWITTSALGAHKALVSTIQEEMFSPPPSEQDMFFRVPLLDGGQIVIQNNGIVQESGKRELQITIPGNELQVRKVYVTGGTTFHEAHSSDGSVVVIATELVEGEEQIFAYDRQKKIFILTGLPQELTVRKVCLSPDNRLYALVTDGQVQVLGVVRAKKGDQLGNMAIAERGVWMPAALEKTGAFEKDIVFAENNLAVFFAYQPDKQGSSPYNKLVEYLKVVDCATITAGVIGAKLIPIKGEAQPIERREEGEHRITQEFRKNGRSFKVRDFICTARNLFFIEGSGLDSGGNGTLYQYNFKEKDFKVQSSSVSRLSREKIENWDQEPFVKQGNNILASPKASPRWQSSFFPASKQLPKSFVWRNRWYLLAGSAAALITLVLGIYRYRTGSWRLPHFKAFADLLS